MGNPVTQAVLAQGLAARHSGGSFLSDSGEVGRGLAEGVGPRAVRVPPKPGDRTALLAPVLTGFQCTRQGRVSLERGGPRWEPVSGQLAGHLLRPRRFSRGLEACGLVEGRWILCSFSAQSVYFSAP